MDLAEAHLREMAAAARPGWTERDVATFLHGLCRRDGAEPSWGWNACPNVHIGPYSRPSHAPPMWVRASSLACRSDRCRTRRSI